MLSIKSSFFSPRLLHLATTASKLELPPSGLEHLLGGVGKDVGDDAGADGDALIAEGEARSRRQNHLLDHHQLQLGVFPWEEEGVDNNFIIQSF